MKLIILKTDIKTKKKVKKIKPILNNTSVIDKWTVDTEDIDNVLRIEAHDTTNEDEIIKMVHQHGFNCEALPDY